MICKGIYFLNLSISIDAIFYDVLSAHICSLKYSFLITPILLILQITVPTNPPLQKLPIHPCDVGDGDGFGAFCFAGVGVGTVSESQFVHGGDHILHAGL